MIVREATWDDPAGVSLRKAQRDELTIRYDDPNSEPGPAPTADDITLFLIAEDQHGVPVGCGGLRQLDDVHGEIKRMFIAPGSRGSGAATLILHGLERRALELGWQRLVLETGDLQPDAIRFYEREGYTRIPNFGHYVDSPLSLCYELAL